MVDFFLSAFCGCLYCCIIAFYNIYIEVLLSFVKKVNIKTKL